MEDLEGLRKQLNSLKNIQSEGYDLNTESIDAVFSILTLLAFVIPLIIKKK